MKKRMILLFAICAVLVMSIQAFAWGGDYKFVFTGTASKPADDGEELMTKLADGDLYAYVTLKTGGNYEGNISTNNAYIHFRVRDVNRNYATEYCTVSKYLIGVTQKMRYLDSDAGYTAENYYLYGNCEIADSWPVVASGTWCP